MNQLRGRVLELYEANSIFQVGWNPFLNRTSWFSFGLLGGQFFGFSVPVIAAAIEKLPYAATTGIGSCVENPHPYVFCHVLPSSKEFEDAGMELHKTTAAREKATLSSGCARTDGWHASIKYR